MSLGVVLTIDRPAALSNLLTTLPSKELVKIDNNTDNKFA
jgi:hypothetical protein